MSQFFYDYSEWELTGPVRGSRRETEFKANQMNPTANPDNESVILNSNNNNNNNNNTDNYNPNQEEPPPTNSKNDADKVDNPEVNFLSQAVDARRSYELDKIRRHKMEAAEDIERYKKEKLQRLQAKEDEKKRDLQMLTNYYPWGRSLGNFERTNYRRQKWNHTGSWPANYIPQPQELAPHPNIPPQSLRWPLDLKDLNPEEEVNKVSCDELGRAVNNLVKRAELVIEEEGGTQREILYPEKNKERLDLTDPNEHYDPDIQFELMKDQHQEQENTRNMEQDEKNIDGISNGHKRKYVTSDPNPKYVGVLSPRVKRSPSPSEVMRARAARVYMEELKKGMEEQRKKKEEMEKEVRAPMGELVTVMGKGKVGRPRRDPLTGILLDNHLKTSDVSKEKIGKLMEENSTEKAKYGYDLIHAAEERYRLKELEKLKAKQQEIQHQETYNEIWGRPGGGAPRDSKLGNRMAKLDNMLYINSNNIGKSYAENQEQQISPTVRYSTHQNYYDYPNRMKEFKEYNFRTPWASYY